MKQHPAASIFLVILFIFISMGSAFSAEDTLSRPDIIIKISRLDQAIRAIDKMAGADIDHPTSSPSYLLRSMLFGTDWIDQSRSIVIGMNFNKIQADEKPAMTALIPFSRKNEDFHISYNAVSKLDYYLLPLPPGGPLTISDQMHYDLAEAAKTKPEGIISIELASSQLLEKADLQIQKMLLEIDSKLKNPKNTVNDLSPEDVSKLLKNLINAAKQLETLSMGIDITASDLIFYSDALAIKKTDLSKLFSRNAGSRTSHMGKYTPKHQINVRSASYDVKGMMTFFNSIFGEFYKKIGLDLAEIETMASYFTGEVAGGVSFRDTGMDVEMIAVLNQKYKPAREFIESVYLPWMMDYGRKMAVFYKQQTPGWKLNNIFKKTPDSTVLGHKVFGLNCEIPLVMPDNPVSNQLSFNLRTTEIGNLLLTASSDEKLKKLIGIAGTLEKQPYEGPLMQMDMDMSAYFNAVQKMAAQAGTDVEFDSRNLGHLEYTLDISKRKLSNKYVISMNDIQSIVSVFKQAGEAAMDAETDSTYAAERSFSRSAPTMLQHSGEQQMPGPENEDSAEFWIDKGLLYATYGNDKEAIKFYKKALQIEPDNPRTLFNMGLSYSSMGNYEMAVNALNQALFLEPDNGDYQYGLGWVYLLKGESGKALEYIRTAADLGNPDAKKYLMKNK